MKNCNHYIFNNMGHTCKKCGQVTYTISTKNGYYCNVCAKHLKCEESGDGINTYLARVKDLCDNHFPNFGRANDFRQNYFFNILVDYFIFGADFCKLEEK